MKSKHLVHIKLFGVVTIDGNVMFLFIFSHGFTLNTEAYIKWLGQVVLSWSERVATERRYIWQQDFDRRIQFWLSEKFCENITPNI